jgi:hypothetical protein
MTSHQQGNCLLKCTCVFELLYKEVPTDGSCEPKHVVQREVALHCSVLLDGILSFVCLHLIAKFCLLNLEKHTNLTKRDLSRGRRVGA